MSGFSPPRGGAWKHSVTLPSLRSSALSWGRAGWPDEHTKHALSAPTPHDAVTSALAAYAPAATLCEAGAETIRGCRAATTPFATTIKSRSKCTHVVLNVKRKFRPTAAPEEGSAAHYRRTRSHCPDATGRRWRRATGSVFRRPVDPSRTAAEASNRCFRAHAADPCTLRSVPKR